MIIGYCSNEGLLFTSSHYSTQSSTDEEFVPPFFVLLSDIELKEKMMKKIRKIYQTDINPDNKFLVSIWIFIYHVYE